MRFLLNFIEQTRARPSITYGLYQNMGLSSEFSPKRPAGRRALRAGKWLSAGVGLRIAGSRAGRTITLNTIRYARCRVSSSLGLCLFGGGANRKLPFGANKMTGVAVRNSLQIVLMFRFRFPEIARRRDFRH